ncbi:tripartite tricarboxylate transporter TctB family protein [Primorskyibacter flagellatus]|nr:tripartite tricarboxylate transporter TctB family protein [Primorskyibacter flagellatus]
MNQLAGGLCLLAGLVLAALAMAMPVGSLSRMGPGFLPLAIAGGLCMIGVCIALFDRDATGIARPAEIRSQLRALAAVLGAVALFALLVDRAGLVPTSALSAFAASFAMRDISWTARVTLSAVIAVICIAIFHFGLRLPVPLIGA